MLAMHIRWGAVAGGVRRNVNRRIAVGVAALAASLAVVTPAAHAATDGATVPGAPTGLTPAPGNTTVALVWTAPASDGGAPITGYDVYEGTSSGGESPDPVNGSVIVTGTSATVRGLTNGTLYYFTVEAVNDVGSSAASNEASATPATAPGPPTGLTAAAGDTSVTISWTAPVSNGGSAITGYTVYDGTASGGESHNPAVCTSVTTTSCTVADLASGVPYYFIVTAVNAFGSSTASNEVMATPMIGPPGAPTDLTATPGNSTVTLDWTAPTSDGGATISGYLVYMGAAPGGESVNPVGCTPTSATSCEVTGLTNDITYYFIVKAQNVNGNSSPSDEASATPASQPGPPTGVGATPGNTSVALGWNAPASDGGSPITGYDVYEGTSSGGESSVPVNRTIITVTSYTVAGLTNGIRYYFTVTAVNAAGSSVASAEVSAVPVITAPGAPTGLAATPGNLSVGLAWFPPSSDGGSAITGYDVYEGTTSGGESPTPVNGEVLVTGTSATVVGLSNGTTYYFIVKAVNSVGSSAFSNEASAVPALPASSETTLELSQGKVIYGHEQVEHLAVAVSPESPGPTPSGSVSIQDSTRTVCVITLSSGAGSCILPARALPAGRYRLTAVYSGALDFEGSSSPGQTLVIDKATSRAVLKLSATRIAYGHEQVEHLTVAVSPEYAGSTPSGTVAVKESTATLCAIRLTSGKGSCSLAAKKLPAGIFHLIVTYGGSPDFAASTSLAQTLVVAK